MLLGMCLSMRHYRGQGHYSFGSLPNGNILYFQEMPRWRKYYFSYNHGKPTVLSKGHTSWIFAEIDPAECKVVQQFDPAEVRRNRLGSKSSPYAKYWWGETCLR